MLAADPAHARAGTNPRVLAQFEPYLKALIWGILPLLLYTAFRRYLQAVDVVKPVTFALVSANLVNVVGNWVLMYGHWGAPAMGLAGSGWSTHRRASTWRRCCWARWCGTSARSGTPAGADARGGRIWARIRRLIALGLPAAGQIGFEGAVFGVVTVLAARLDEVSLAAHSIAVQVIATTFMVPLGISSAAAVRVGQAVGRKDCARRGARRLDGAVARQALHGQRRAWRLGLSPRCDRARCSLPIRR